MSTPAPTMTTTTSETARLIAAFAEREIARPLAEAVEAAGGDGAPPRPLATAAAADDPGGWVLQFRGRRWTARDALVKHVAVVGELVGDAWENLEPWRSPRLVGAWITAFLTDETGDLDAALVLVYAAPAADLLTACTRT